MPTLSKELRRTLENVVADARRIAEAGAEQALKQLAVYHSESWPAMTTEEKALREKLRAHGKQLGDKREANRTQEIPRLKQACAYEHWHRMLFARFLAENNLLIHPEYGEPLSMEEVRELAREQNADWLSIATSFAQKMLLGVFRADDPVLDLVLPPETRQKLEEKLAALPTEVFTAEDSLGWVYQFWQCDEKERVSKSEAKIGADELAPVTQLFTEDYMVLFLLHNTLGAWWTAKRSAEGKGYDLTGYEWTYLRLNEDGSPAAGSYDGWPHAVREIRVLDPCMGSGHFLAAALPILAQMRAEEEGLSLRDALAAVLQDNIFGLEIDARCAQIAAFNLALTAWRLAGEHFPLPATNLACSGLGIYASEDDWVRLAGEDGMAREEMRRLYSLFKEAPTLGSLINPSAADRNLLMAAFQDIQPLLGKALAQEIKDESAYEMVVTARGLAKAAELLTSEFTLVATNVPYVGYRKHSLLLKSHIAANWEVAKSDLALAFALRCNELTCASGHSALVLPLGWLNQSNDEAFRRLLLSRHSSAVIVRLGSSAFTSAIGQQVMLFIFNNKKDLDQHTTVLIDALDGNGPEEKSRTLVERPIKRVARSRMEVTSQNFMIGEDVAVTATLGHFADCLPGLSTGDKNRFERFFWEVPTLGSTWAVLHETADATGEFGGMQAVLRWEDEAGELAALAAELRHLNHAVQSWRRGKPFWGKKGVTVNRMGSLNRTTYLGDKFSADIGVIVPRNQEHVPAIWTFCFSDEFLPAVRSMYPKPEVPPSYLVNIPFDLAYWQEVAAEKYPDGLPRPFSDDPTQWLFKGHPRGADRPLHVAVARLLGYRWPRQTGSSFPDCPTLDPDPFEAYADSDGIVTLNALAGKAAAADRLRPMLAEAYGTGWCAAKLAELVGNCESLESWLRDRFFEEHCQIFHQRPFIWHVWDGRRDGFHALINYHKLAGKNGLGRQTLEKLVYTSLGDWITRQRAEVSAGTDGAEARLVAALHLKTELEKILEGQEPYDIFVRWKPVHEQPIGWEPDVNDGIRLNIRPWLVAKPYRPSRQGTCILRATPIKLPLGKDRGKEHDRNPGDFPWFADTRDRSNDLHLTLDEKRKARERRKK